MPASSTIVRARAWFAFAAIAMALVACASGPPGIDGIISANAHDLYLYCGGGPGPTVVFEAAIGGDHSLWPISDQIEGDAYTCVYDRAGNGASSIPDEPQTASADVEDLHALLEAANIPAPVVLVGHSYGGLVAWLAAVQHPEDVAGLVLIDASHPDQVTRWDAILDDTQMETLLGAYDDFPYVDFLASLEESRAATEPFPEIPLTVITATQGLVGEGCGEGLPCDGMQAIWLELQDEYAALRPDSVHIETPTGHYVQDENPDLVLTEIRNLLARVSAE